MTALRKFYAFAGMIAVLFLYALVLPFMLLLTGLLLPLSILTDWLCNLQIDFKKELRK